MSRHRVKAHSRDCQLGQCGGCTWTRCVHRCHSELPGPVTGGSDIGPGYEWYRELAEDIPADPEPTVG